MPGRINLYQISITEFTSYKTLLSTNMQVKNILLLVSALFMSAMEVSAVPIPAPNANAAAILGQVQAGLAAGGLKTAADAVGAAKTAVGNGGAGGAAGGAAAAAAAKPAAAKLSTVSPVTGGAAQAKSTASLNKAVETLM